MKPEKNQIQFTLRIKKDLRDSLKTQALYNKRSLNCEIEFRLEKSLAKAN